MCGLTQLAVPLVNKMLFFILLVLPSSGLSSSSILSYVFLSSVLLVLLLSGNAGAGHSIDSSRFMIPPGGRRSYNGYPSHRSPGDSNAPEAASYEYGFTRGASPQHPPLSLTFTLPPEDPTTPTAHTPDTPIPNPSMSPILTSSHKRPRKLNSRSKTTGDVRPSHQERHRKSRPHRQLFLHPKASPDLPKHSKFPVYSSGRTHSLRLDELSNSASVGSNRDTLQPPLKLDTIVGSGGGVNVDTADNTPVSRNGQSLANGGGEKRLYQEHSEQHFVEGEDASVMGSISGEREHSTLDTDDVEKVNFVDPLDQTDSQESEVTLLADRNVEISAGSEDNGEKTVRSDSVSPVSDTYTNLHNEESDEVRADEKSKTKSKDQLPVAENHGGDNTGQVTSGVSSKVPVNRRGVAGSDTDATVRESDQNDNLTHVTHETKDVMVYVVSTSSRSEVDDDRNEASVIEHTNDEGEGNEMKVTRERETEESLEHQNQKRFVDKAGNVGDNNSTPDFGFGAFHISPFNPDQGFDSPESATLNPLRHSQTGANPTFLPGGELDTDTSSPAEGAGAMSPPILQPLTDPDATLLHVREGSPRLPTPDGGDDEGKAEEENNNETRNKATGRSVPTWEKKLQVAEEAKKVLESEDIESSSEFNREHIQTNDAQLTRRQRLHYIYKKNKIERTGGLRRIKNLKDNNVGSPRRVESQEPMTDQHNIPPPAAGEEAVEELGNKITRGTTTVVRGATTTITNRGTSRRRSQASSVPLLDTEGSVRIPCYVIIFLLGVVGNTLVIVTLLQNRKMRTITNVFLLNLAFSDLLLGVFCMPFTLVGSLLRDFIFGPIMCRLIPYFQAVSVSVSVWTLVAISLERYYAICQPLRSRGWQTLSHAYKIISLVWLLSLVFMAPIAALSQLLPVGDTSRHKCREMWPSLHLERGFSMFLCAGLLLVPLVIMVAAYSSITVSLWHGMKLERETGQGTQPLISLTDLNGLAMVQQSLRRKHSRRHVSKISIRFRKIPAQTRTCEHCGQPESVATPSEVVGVVHETSPNDLAHTTPTTGQEGGATPHVCLHGRDCQNYKWHVESVRENGNLESPPHRKESKTGFKRLRSTHLEKSIEAKKHVIKMLFVVVLEFFLCWTPIFVVNIMCLYIPEQVYRALGSFGISFMHLLSYASSCCNPITYCFMNKKFLQGFRHAFGCRKENERIGRLNGTAASFRSQSNNAFKLAMEIKKDTRETTV